ncbi:MAG: hypothetical protein Q4C01_05080 [Clostridia bacterium]|nr:hypothetical protein [Clostridia bacterium]
MDAGVFIALISFFGTVLGSLSGVLASARLTTFRLKRLEEKVDAHNHLVERMAVVEQRVDAIEKEIEKEVA